MYENALLHTHRRPIVAELPRRPVLSPRVKRAAWRLAFAAADAVLLAAAISGTLLLLAAVLGALPPIG